MHLSDPPTVQPINYAGADIYRDRIPGWRRRLTLSGDRLVIHARRFYIHESEIPVSLHSADPVYATGWRRSAIASVGAIFLGAIFGAMTIGAAHDQNGWRFAFIYASIDGILAIICLVTGVRYFRRVQYVSFAYNGGRFEIARDGPDREKFDAFVARVVERIQMLRGQTS